MDRTAADSIAGRSPFGQSTEWDASELSVDLWKEIQRVSDNAVKAVDLLPGAGTIRRILDSIPQPGPVAVVGPKQADWTISIDLTTHFAKGYGVYSALENLHDFAKQTKGKNITLVAQAAVPDTEEFDPNGLPITNSSTKYRLERFIIKDGKIENVGNEASEGYAKDLEKLLTYVNKNHPSKRTALIMDSHGHGNEGLHGDSGNVSVAEFVKAVQGGLKGSGHERLDLLDFDACLMAADGAISKIHNVADQVVACAETEGIENGQNYLAPIKRLCDKPDADGFTLARDIVVQTHKDMQNDSWWDNGEGPPVISLSHLNLRQYDAFRKSLDQFGDQLLLALNDKNSKRAIESAIDSSLKYGHSFSNHPVSGNWDDTKNRTDLKQFTESVLAAVDNGDIKDPDRSLKKAAQELMNQRSLLVDSYHGEEEYAKAGGLSVFLPGRNLRNVEKEALLCTPAGRISDMTDEKYCVKVNKDDKSRESFLKKVQAELFLCRPHLYVYGVKGADKEIDQIEKLANEFSKAKDDSQRQAIFKQLHQAAIDLSNTESCKNQVQKHLTVLKDNAAKMYKINVNDDYNGWSKFRLQLRDSK